MKEQLFITAFLFFFSNVFSQITVTDSDLVNVGDVIYKAYDDNPASTILVGSPGSNQSWDFSSLQMSSIDTLFFVDPLTTVNSNLYPASNLAMLQQGSVNYFNKGSNGMFLHGLSDTVFSSPALFYPLPLTNTTNISDGPILVIDNIISDITLLNLALPPATVATLTNGVYNNADTASVKIMNTTDFLVDASGIMTTPLGSFDVLRLKSIKYTNSELDIYCSDTISGLGAWVSNVPFSSIPFLSGFENNEIAYKYEWITDDDDVAFLVAEAVVDSLDNIMVGVSFQIEQPLSLFEQSSTLDLVNIYPNPAMYSLTIESEQNRTIDLTLRDMSGSVILEDHFNNSTTLSLDRIAKGIYYLTLKSGDKRLVKKVVVD